MYIYSTMSVHTLVHVHIQYNWYMYTLYSTCTWSMSAAGSSQCSSCIGSQVCYIRWFTIYHSIMCCIMLYMFVERYSVLMNDTLHYDPALRLGSQYDALCQLNTDTRQT